MLPVTCLHPEMSLGAYFRYEIYTSVFAVYTLLPLLPNSVMPLSPMLSPCHCYLLPGGLAYSPIPKMISIGEILEYFQGPHTPDAEC